MDKPCLYGKAKREIGKKKNTQNKLMRGKKKKKIGRRAFKRREKQIKVGARLEPAAHWQHSRLRSCWWKSSVPCLGCSKKQNTVSLLVILPLLSSRPHKQEEGLSCQTQACVCSNAKGCRACLPCHTCVHTPVRPGAQRLGSSEPDRTCQAPCGCGGSSLRGDARALATMASSFLSMREKEVGGLGMEEKGRVEGCNAWLEKFRGVQRQAR